MVKCKVCGKEFHACSSCGMSYNWEYDYCNETCWRKSNEYVSARLEIQMAQVKLNCELEDLYFDEDVLADMINHERTSII